MAKRYVELENLINTVKATPRCDLSMALMIANNYATADVVEVKNGHNANLTYHEADEFRCSECGIHLEDWEMCIDEDEDVWGEFVFKYCPNCGVKMESD